MIVLRIGHVCGFVVCNCVCIILFHVCVLVLGGIVQGGFLWSCLACGRIILMRVLPNPGPLAMWLIFPLGFFNVFV